jgi:hypothetical protein
MQHISGQLAGVEKRRERQIPIEIQQQAVDL